MKTILDTIPESAVQLEPFPYVLIENAIPDELCNQLIKELPPLDVLTHNLPLGSNQRFDFTVSDERREHALTPLWRDFLEAQASPDFFRNVTRLFGAVISEKYPQLLATYGPLETWKVGNRYVDSHHDKTVLLDAHISTNSPTRGKSSSVRRAHVDDPKKIYTGLLYLRLPNDTTEGADLELYRYKDVTKKKFFGQAINDKYLEVVKTVPYRKNTLILFLNSIDSLHGVTDRAVSATPRHFVNLIGEMKEPIFDLVSVQENIWIRRVRTLFGKWNYY